MSTLKGLSLAAGAAGIALAAATPAQAGLFEFLFGGAFERPQPQYHERSAPLDVHVTPRRKPAQPHAVKAAPDRKPVLAKAIDPVKRPNWYLEDPTLRRGDIVVLKGQVLVYEGGGRGSATKADFMSLDKSRLISKGEKSRIEKMADTSGPVTEPVVAPNKEAALRSPQ